MATKNFWDYRETQGYGPTDVEQDSAYMGFPHFNKGLDFGTPDGIPIRAVVGGEVVASGHQDDGWGISVKVRDEDGNTHNYGHLTEALAAQGSMVAPGALLGTSGHTGNVTGPHLSYDVWDTRGHYFDPRRFIDSARLNPAFVDVPEEQGPNGRTVSEIEGTPYLSARERLWYTEKTGGLVTPEMRDAARAEEGDQTSTDVGFNGRTVAEITGTAYLSSRERVWFLQKTGHADQITDELLRLAAGEG